MARDLHDIIHEKIAKNYVEKLKDKHKQRTNEFNNKLDEFLREVRVQELILEQKINPKFVAFKLKYDAVANQIAQAPVTKTEKQIVKLARASGLIKAAQDLPFAETVALQRSLAQIETKTLNLGIDIDKYVLKVMQGTKVLGRDPDDTFNRLRAKVCEIINLVRKIYREDPEPCPVCPPGIG